MDPVALWGAGILAAVAGARLVFPDPAGGLWWPTPMPVVRRVLAALDLQPGELLVDLGAGDGRVVALAAREYGARAVGYELSPTLVWVARRRTSGLAPGVRIVRGDFYRADVSAADAITIFAAPGALRRLAPRLAGECPPAVRIATYPEPLPGWPVTGQVPAICNRTVYVQSRTRNPAARCCSPPSTLSAPLPT